MRAEDLQETLITGYGAANYSWHDIGIELRVLCFC